MWYVLMLGYLKSKNKEIDMNRKLGAVIIAVAVAVGIYFMTAEKKLNKQLVVKLLLQR